MKRATAILLACTAMLFATPAKAKLHRSYQGWSYDDWGRTRQIFQARSSRYSMRQHGEKLHHRSRRHPVRVADRGVVVGGRPRGCPHAYCGCGTSLYIFGRIRPELNLAWNWARYFEREPVPRAGLVAVRRGHVMAIVGGSPGAWIVYDPNSGRGLTRRHVRPLNGYLFVNPEAPRIALR